MKYPKLAKYSNKGLRKTLIEMQARTDLSEDEKKRRFNMIIEELRSRGQDPISDILDDVKDLVDKMPKKKS